jgi:hypothetical protein
MRDSNMKQEKRTENTKKKSPELIKLEEDKILLKKYLSQYYRCKNRKKQLEARLQDIKDEINAPIGGVGYSQTPRSVTNKVGAGSASIVFKMADIEERIIEQKDIVAKTMIKVMDMIEFLSVESTERMILEYRYIDCLEWERISREASFSRTTCNDYFNAGLERLLKFKKVQKLLSDYSKEIDNV